MGSKAPVVLKSRGSRNKCDYCSRILPSLTSLRAHQLSDHPNRLKEREKRMVTRSKSQKKKLTTVVGKTIVKEPGEEPINDTKKESKERSVIPPEKVETVEDTMLKTPEKVNLSLLEDKECTIPLDVTETVTTEPVKKPVKNSLPRNLIKEMKIEFSCPCCDRSAYSTYFSALRHIQKLHCADKDGNPVSPNDPELIKPIRVEQCNYCCEKIKSTEQHICPLSKHDAKVVAETRELICLSCNSKFTNSKFFDLHLSGRHHDSFDGMFFTNIKEAQNWLDNMETITNTDYNLVGKINNKKIYRCSYNEPSTIPGTTKSVVCICPSTIILQEFAKGTQIDFCKRHSGHTTRKYEIPERFKQYLITSNVKKTERVPTRLDLYVQLKKVLEKVLDEAVNVNIQDLKKLSVKALELAAILDLDDADLRLVINKVKYSSNDETETPPKRPRRKSQLVEREASPPKLVNTYSLTNDRRLVRTSTSKQRSLDQSPTFNDSYQQFVSTLKGQSIMKNEKSKPNLLKKKVVKTKMGQFKPSPEKKAASIDGDKRLSLGAVKEIEYEVKVRENDCNILVLKI